MNSKSKNWGMNFPVHLKSIRLTAQIWIRKTLGPEPDF